MGITEPGIGSQAFHHDGPWELENAPTGRELVPARVLPMRASRSHPVNHGRRIGARITTTIVLAVLLFSAGVGAGAAVTYHGVCHAISEDTFPYDCDYVHGAWIPKR